MYFFKPNNKYHNSNYEPKHILVYIPIPIEMNIEDIHSAPKTVRSVNAAPRASAPSIQHQGCKAPRVRTANHL